MPARAGQARAEARLGAIWRRLLGRADIDAESDWFELRPGHKTPLLLDAIRAEFGIDLPIAVVYRDSRLADLARTLVTGDIPERIERIVPLRTGRRPPALVYVPGAFGEDLHARDELVKLDHPVYLLLAPGLGEGEHPASAIGELAEHYLDQVRRSLPDEPAVLAGFSLGAQVAMEMDRLGASRGWRPRRVVLIDLLPPLEDGALTELDEDDVVTFRLQRLVDRIAAGSDVTPPACFGSDLTPGKIGEITAFLHENHSPDLPPGVPFSFLERRLRVYAAGVRAGAADTIRPCPSPVGFIRTTDGRELGITWESVSTAGPTEILDVHGTHSTLWREGVGAAALEHFLTAAAPATR